MPFASPREAAFDCALAHGCPLPVLAEFAIDLLELLVRVVRQRLAAARFRRQAVEGGKSDVPQLGAARLWSAVLGSTRSLPAPSPFRPGRSVSASEHSCPATPRLVLVTERSLDGRVPHVVSSSSPIRSSTNMCAQQAFRSSWPCGRMCA